MGTFNILEEHTASILRANVKQHGKTAAGCVKEMGHGVPGA